MSLPAKGILGVGKTELEGDDRSESTGHRVDNKEVLKEKQPYKARFMFNIKN